MITNFAFSHFTKAFHQCQIPPKKSVLTFEHESSSIDSYRMILSPHVASIDRQKRSAPNPSMMNRQRNVCLHKFIFVALDYSVLMLLPSPTPSHACRPMVPQLAPPKIPEGERVDFDVRHKKLFHHCYCACNMLGLEASGLFFFFFFLVYFS